MSAAFAAVGALQIWNGLQQADSIMFNADLTRQINRANAENLELEAFKAETFGFTQSARYQTVIDKTLGSQKAAFAGQGVDVNTGTAAALQAESRFTGFLNQLDIQQAARNKAKGLRQKASNTRLQGLMSQIQSEVDANAARIGGVVGAAATFASGYKPTNTPNTPNTPNVTKSGGTDFSNGGLTRNFRGNTPDGAFSGPVV